MLTATMKLRYLGSSPATFGALLSQVFPEKSPNEIGDILDEAGDPTGAEMIVTAEDLGRLHMLATVAASEPGADVRAYRYSSGVSEIVDIDPEEDETDNGFIIVMPLGDLGDLTAPTPDLFNPFDFFTGGKVDPSTPMPNIFGATTNQMPPERPPANLGDILGLSELLGLHRRNGC